MRITPELMLTHVANTLWKLHRTNQPQGVDLALRLLARRCGPHRGAARLPRPRRPHRLADHPQLIQASPRCHPLRIALRVRRSGSSG